MKQRLDTYDRIPPAMADYLSQYGWHFSKKNVLMGCFPHESGK